MELEQLIDTFRRSVLLATDSPLSPPSTPRPPNGVLIHQQQQGILTHSANQSRGFGHQMNHQTVTSTTTVTNSSLNSVFNPLHDVLQSTLSPMDHEFNPSTNVALEDQISLSYPRHYASLEARTDLAQQQQQQQQLQSLANQQQINEQIAIAAMQRNQENNLLAEERLLYCKDSSSDDFTTTPPLCSENGAYKYLLRY